VQWLAALMGSVLAHLGSERQRCRPSFESAPTQDPEAMVGCANPAASALEGILRHECRHGERPVTATPPAKAENREAPWRSTTVYHPEPLDR